MPKTSAGILMYRERHGRLEVLLVHPGGPLWATKDSGAWFIPKGETEAGEDLLMAARREFEEETGIKPERELVFLGAVRHKSGKTVSAWAFEGDCDPAQIRSNEFTMEWPPHSGERREFPEVDRAEFFGIDEARGKIISAEFPLLERLQEIRHPHP